MKSKRMTIKKMFEDLYHAPKIYKPSAFWQNLIKDHTEKLSRKKGYENFKQTISKRYFNGRMIDITTHQLPIVFKELFRGNLDPLFMSRIEKAGISALIYRIYTAYLFDYVHRKDKLGLLVKLQEPQLGNPSTVSYKNSFVSQDLCNSVHEFYSATESKKQIDFTDIAEIGAGYGRLAFVFLKVFPKASYTIIDLPPALNIAQKYLSDVFPKEKIFYYRSFDNFIKVNREFELSRIRFLMPHQIELLPTRSFSTKKKMFNLLISVSTFHEMTRAQIRNYFYHINRLTSGYFYFKQYIISRVIDSGFISLNEYPIHKSWKKIYKRFHPVQVLFFEALYKIN